MKIKRRSMQSSPEFIKRLKMLQGKIKERIGEEPSLTYLTNEIIRSENFSNIEEQIIKKITEKDKKSNFNINLKFDGRF